MIYEERITCSNFTANIKARFHRISHKNYPCQAVYMQFTVINIDLASDDCPRDVLLIYNGYMAVGEAEKRICGHWRGWEWITKGNDTVLQLISDESDTYQGFYLNFQSINKVLLPGMLPYDMWTDFIFHTGLRVWASIIRLQWGSSEMNICWTAIDWPISILIYYLVIFL